MKIAINQQPYDGPWGGGNRFLQTIVSDLKAHGHDVVFDLSSFVDVILMVETRVRSPNVAFGAGKILRYLIHYPNTLIVHRINECDERKGEKFITDKLLRANYVADYTVFVGAWLMDLPAWKYKDKSKFFVILNGADENIFNKNSFEPWNGSNPIKLVTHHWGAHPNKGFDVYKKIDNELNNHNFSQKFSMTYIGNLPKNFLFKNIHHISPLNGIDLALAIKSNHAYLTASINEPGGNHQNEGALCGLPIIYRNSGCMPEYCGRYGMEFEGCDDIISRLLEFHSQYKQYLEQIQKYPHTAQKCAKQWREFFEMIIKDKDKIIKSRKIFRNPYLFFRNQLPI